MSTKSDTDFVAALHEHMAPLGCSWHATRVFGAILHSENGTTALHIARMLNMPRTSVYDHLRWLEEQGLVLKAHTGEAPVFVAADQAAIRGWADERQRSLAAATRGLGELLTRAVPTPHATPRFFIADSVRAYRAVFAGILRAGTLVRWYWPVRSMRHAIPGEIFEEYRSERIRRNISIRVLWPASHMPKPADPRLSRRLDAEALREVRIAPPELTAAMGYGVYGTKVTFIASDREHYAMTVESADMAEIMAQQFDHLWRSARKGGRMR